MRIVRIGVLAVPAAVALTVAFAGAGRSQDTADAERSAALFQAMMPVLSSPRCMNCHPAGDTPRQGEEGRLHQMLVTRGPDGFGSPALRCGACHRAVNSPNSNIPGAEDWHLAPRGMAWEGLSAGALCRLLLDPTRNGGLTADGLVAHMETSLVQWAWSPGIGLDGEPRRAPPSSGAHFVELTRAWVASGARCPTD